VGAVGAVTGTVAAGCLGLDTIAIPLASRCTPVVGTVKVAAHVQVARHAGERGGDELPLGWP
jgi:hypothetical protein